MSESSTGVERPTIDVVGAEGGWPDPWPNVAEISAVLSHDKWTLVGGLMTQLHCVHRGLGVVRPTNDIDIVLHVETTRGVAAEATSALQSLGYELRQSVDPRDNTAHRFQRGANRVDLVTSSDEAAHEVVDVLVADHHAPSVSERLAGRDMISIDGGTQALRRTVNARLTNEPDTVTTISVPGPFGALILKAAAYKADSRDPERHVRDAVALLACIEDPFYERENFMGSDRSRLHTLRDRLTPDDIAWTVLSGQDRVDAESALDILVGDSDA